MGTIYTYDNYVKSNKYKNELGTPRGTPSNEIFSYSISLISRKVLIMRRINQSIILKLVVLILIGSL